jgi:outer membrane immunogenic protein
MNRAHLLLALLAGASILPPSALAQTTSDWTGFYVGGSVGGSLKTDESETVVFDTNRDAVFNDTVFTAGGVNAFTPDFCSGGAQGNAPAAGCRDSNDQVNYSLRAGYDWQFGNWVVGAVGEYSVQNIGDDVSAFSTTPASYTFSRDLNSVISLRGRGGYAFGSSLVYGTAGLAWADMDHSFNTTNGANSFTPRGGDGVDGFQVGAGYEMDMASMGMSGWSLGVEYLWTSLDDGSYQVAVGPGTAAPTNPFLLVNPTGTDMKRSNDDFEYGSLGLTLALRQ